MIGIVLGLGFQWWPNLIEPWQYIAFIFVYIDIVDYWMDYGPSLKRFPPKREVDVLLDVAIMFSLFLYIYTAQLTILYFLGAFILTRVLDFFWLLSSKVEYHPEGMERKYIDSWLTFNIAEIIVAICLAVVQVSIGFPSLWVLILFLACRAIIRVLASLQYKKIHLA